MKKILYTLLTLAVLGINQNMEAQSSKDKTSSLFSTAQATKSKAQVFFYKFTASTGTYQNLSNPISLNNNMVWDDPFYTVGLPFNFEMFDEAIDSVSFGFSFGGSLIAIPSDTTKGIYPIIAPLEADLIDRGDTTGISQSPLSYKVDGTAPNQILKMEWQNCGSYDEMDSLGTLNDYVNFQLWIHESSHKMEFRYGPSSVQTPEAFYYINNGPIIGLASYDFFNDTLMDMHFLQGTPGTPTLVDNDTNFTGTPADGTIYTFEEVTVSLESRIGTSNLSLYPNPAGDYLDIKAGQDLHDVEYQIINSGGQSLLNGTLEQHRIDLSSLPAGWYFIKLKNGSAVQTQAFAIKR